MVKNVRYCNKGTEDVAEGTADAEENNTEEAKNGNILTDTLLSLHHALSR